MMKRTVTEFKELPFTPRRYPFDFLFCQLENSRDFKHALQLRIGIYVSGDTLLVIALKDDNSHLRIVGADDVCLVRENFVGDLELFK